MAGLRRFLHLERPRRDDAPGPPRPQTGRFDALEQPGEPAPGVGDATGASAGRFGPEHVPGLELAERVEGARPFQRCPACGRDHGLHEALCACGARLDTPEVQAWNDQLWAARAAEDRRHAAEAAEAKVRAAREAEELAKLKYEMGIELARQVGERERARLGGLDGGWSGGGAGKALGVRLWEALPERLRARVFAAIAAAWFGLLVYAAARRSPGAFFAAIVLVIVAVVPPGRTTRRWGGWS